MQKTVDPSINWTKIATAQIGDIFNVEDQHITGYNWLREKNTILFFTPFPFPPDYVKQYPEKLTGRTIAIGYNYDYTSEISNSVMALMKAIDNHEKVSIEKVALLKLRSDDPVYPYKVKLYEQTFAINRKEETILEWTRNNTTTLRPLGRR
jgi:hypothetical protein